MLILFAATRRINHNPSFGRGILASQPTQRVDYSASDAAWWAQESDRLEQQREDARIDALAVEHGYCDEAERYEEPELAEMFGGRALAMMGVQF